MSYIFEMIADKMYVRLNPVTSSSKTIERNDGTSVDLELPEKHHEETRIGRIVAVGPEAAAEGFDEGQMIVVTFMAGTILHFPADDITDDTHRIIGYREVLCRIVEEDEPVEAEIVEE